MSQHPRQTFIYSPTFRWNEALLEQEVLIIQHYPERDRDVGIFREWHPVKIGEIHVVKIASEVSRPVPHDNLLVRAKSKGMPDTLQKLISDGFPKTGRHLIEFDGGTSCNNPKNFGKGYGSFQIDNGEIHRVEFGLGHSSNSAEIRTLVAALQKLAEAGDTENRSVLVRGDSQIALKWVKCRDAPKAKTSEGFQEAIGLLRIEVAKFRSVKAEWRRRDYSVKLFGH